MDGESNCLLAASVSSTLGDRFFFSLFICFLWKNQRLGWKDSTVIGRTMGSFFVSVLIECDCTSASLVAGCSVSYYPVGLFTNHTSAQLCQRVNLLRFFFSLQQLLFACLWMFSRTISKGTMLSSSSECLDLEWESTQLFCFHVNVKYFSILQSEASTF